MTKTNYFPKINELSSVLNTQFSGTLNLARVKLIALFICSLCKI